MRTGYPTRIHKALSYLVDRMGLILDFPFTIEKTDGYYAAVVCTGSTAFYPGKIAARRRGIPVAAILFPSGYKKLNFDCILAPVFDRPPIPKHYSDSGQSDLHQRRVFTPRPPPPSVNATRPPVRPVGRDHRRAQWPSPRSPRMRSNVILDRLFALTEGRERWGDHLAPHTAGD